MWKACTYMCQMYKSLASNMWTGAQYVYFTSYITCYWDISFKKYTCHIANIGHTALMLYGHMGFTLVHTCVNTANCNICLKCYCHIFDGYISGVCLQVCATYEVTGINHMTRSTVNYLPNYISHYWYISLNISGYNIPHRGHTVLILYGIDWTLIYIWAKIQTAATSSSHQYQHMCHKQIWLPYCIYRGCMNISVPHIMSLASTIWQGAWYININDDNDAKLQLHRLRWPICQVSWISHW